MAVFLHLLNYKLLYKKKIYRLFSLDYNSIKVSATNNNIHIKAVFNISIVYQRAAHFQPS